MPLQSPGQRIFFLFFSRGFIVIALFCSDSFIFHITFVRITFESCTFLLFKCCNNLEIILTTESSEWLCSHLPPRVNPPCASCTGTFNFFLSFTSSGFCSSLRGCERGEKQINMAEGCYEYTISVSGKAQSLFQFSLDLPKESLQKVPLSGQSCAPRMLDEQQSPKHCRPSHVQQLCREEWEQGPDPAVGSSPHCQGTVIF